MKIVYTIRQMYKALFYLMVAFVFYTTIELLNFKLYEYGDVLKWQIYASQQWMIQKIHNMPIEIRNKKIFILALDVCYITTYVTYYLSLRWNLGIIIGVCDIIETFIYFLFITKVLTLQWFVFIIFRCLNILKFGLTLYSAPYFIFIFYKFLNHQFKCNNSMCIK